MRPGLPPRRPEPRAPSASRTGKCLHLGRLDVPFCLRCHSALIVTFSLNKIVAAAGLIAVSATAVAADSNVTVYGRLDTALTTAKVGNQRINGLENSGSYFGFKGVEALGNGMKAGFILESGFNSDTGANSDDTSYFNNRSELFLEGDFGTVRMGRFLNPSYYAIADRASFHNEDYGITADKLYRDIGNINNRVAYTSPEFYGLTVESSIAFHERQNGDHTDKNAYDLAANYDRGNWSFGAGYTKQGQNQQYAVRATWTQDAWTVAAYHQRAKEEAKKTNVSRIAVSYAIGAGEIHANVGRANGENRADANQWTVGYNHHLSKRTKVYAFYSQLQNKHGAEFGGDVFNRTLTTDQDLKSVSVGIRHNF